MNKFLLLLLVLFPLLSFAGDTYEPATGTVTIPHVSVGTDNYAVTMSHQINLVFKVISVLPVSNTSATPDTFDFSSGILNMPAVTVGADSYKVEMFHQGDLVFKVVSAIKNTSGSTSPDNTTPDTTTPDSGTGTSSVFYTPSPISEALQRTRNVAWANLSTMPSDLSRFSMGDPNSAGVVVLTETSTGITPALSVDATMASESSLDNNRLLRSMFKLIAENDGGFRIVSTKHSNYALDINSATDDTLIIRDIRSAKLDTANTAYLVFELSANGNGYTLSAVKRKLYNSATNGFSSDASWLTRSVLLAEGDLSLTSGSGTALRFYAPPINFDIPFDFNPDNTQRVSNPEVTPVARSDDPVAGTANKVADAYKPQVTAAGLSVDTTAAATAMLATIKASLESQNAGMRYPAEFYLVFREGLLKRTLQSSDSTDGELGQLTVPYVYFTNEKDTGGTYHPFMVIVSYGLPDSLALLWDVAKPPGDGLTQSYLTQSVTRSFHREAFMIKIPLRDYGQVGSLTENVMVNNLASDIGVTQFSHHNYTSISATGVAIDGVIIYPAYNNALHFAQSDAELSAHGMHSGRGLGVHYHADAHSATHEGLNLYNEADYEGKSHPPAVSIGFDGIAGYGAYKTADTSSEGATIALDDFGGHGHGTYGYHYHSFTKAASTSSSIPYTVHALPPQGAWAGRINDIPEFWDGPAPNYVGGRSVYLGTQ